MGHCSSPCTLRCQSGIQKAHLCVPAYSQTQLTAITQQTSWPVAGRSYTCQRTATSQCMLSLRSASMECRAFATEVIRAAHTDTDSASEPLADRKRLLLEDCSCSATTFFSCIPFSCPIISAIHCLHMLSGQPQHAPTGRRLPAFCQGPVPCPDSPRRRTSRACRPWPKEQEWMWLP